MNDIDREVFGYLNRATHILKELRFNMNDAVIVQTASLIQTEEYKASKLDLTQLEGIVSILDLAIKNIPYEIKLNCNDLNRSIDLDASGVPRTIGLRKEF